MHPQQYRLRFLLDVARLLVLPQLLLSGILYAIRASYAPRYLWKKIALHLAVPIAGLLRAWWCEANNKRNAGKSHILVYIYQCLSGL